MSQCHPGKRQNPQSVLVHKHLGAKKWYIEKRPREWVEINTITKDSRRGEEEERNKDEAKLRIFMFKINKV